MPALPLAQPGAIPATAPWDPQLAIRSVDLKSGRVAFVEAGAGPPIVCIHGYGDQFITWREQLRDLAADHHVIALDLPGYGYSDKPTLEYTPAFFIDSLLCFLDALGLPRATLVGSSMGAAIALGTAVRHPERVERLVLIGPTTPGVIPTGRTLDLAFRLAQWPAVGLRLMARPPRALVRIGLLDSVQNPALVDAALVDHYFNIVRQPGFARAYLSTALHWREWQDFRPRMAALPHPTLLIWGEADRVHPIRQSGLLRTLIPALEYLPLPCGHLPQRECPAEVNAALRRLINPTAPL